MLTPRLSSQSNATSRWLELSGPAGPQPLELEPAFRQLRADDGQLGHPEGRTRRALSSSTANHAADFRDAVRKSGAGRGKRQDEHPGHQQGHEQRGQAAPPLEPLEQPRVERPTRERQNERPKQRGEKRPQHGQAADRKDHKQRDHHDLFDPLLRSIVADAPCTQHHSRCSAVCATTSRRRLAPLARISKQAQALRVQDGRCSLAQRSKPTRGPPQAAQCSRDRLAYEVEGDRDERGVCCGGCLSKAGALSLGTTGRTSGLRCTHGFAEGFCRRALPKVSPPRGRGCRQIGSGAADPALLRSVEVLVGHDPCHRPALATWPASVPSSGRSSATAVPAGSRGR